MKKYQTFINISISIIIALLLFLLVYRKIDFSQIWYYLRHNSVRYDLLIISVFIEALGNALRGLRWNMQIKPLAEVKAKSYIAILSTLGSYTISLIIPRLGEIWRCSTIAKKERISFPSLLGTLIPDRFADFVVMFFLLVISFSFFFGDSIQLLSTLDFSNSKIAVLCQNLWFWGIGAAILLSIILLFRFGLSRIIKEKVYSFFRRFLDGIRSFRLIEQKWRFMVYTIGMYFFYFGGFYICFYAFDFTHSLGISAGLLAFIMGTLAVALPVQAGIGAWHFMVITALSIFGVSHNDAGIFALVVHTLQTIGTAVLGLIAIFFLSLIPTNKEKKQEM